MKEVEAAIIDDNGRLVHRERFACTREQLIRFATKRIGPNTAVVLESTTNTWTIVDILQPLVKEVVVSNPMRTRAIAHAKIKTDKIDAIVLANLLRADFLPRVWCPDAATKERRALCSRRAALVRPVPSLDSLYEREGLPPTKALANGEMRMLREADLFGYVETINKEQRVRHRRQPKTTEATPETPKTPERGAKRKREKNAGS